MQPRMVSASVISSRYMIKASKSDFNNCFSLSAIVIRVFWGELNVVKELHRYVVLKLEMMCWNGITIWPVFIL